MLALPRSTAVLIDGSFFIKRYQQIVSDSHTAQHVADNIFRFSMFHLKHSQPLHKIFFYDCIPFDKRVHSPISKKIIDFKKLPQYQFRMDLFQELKKRRKVALRLGTLKDNRDWTLRSGVLKALLSGQKGIEDLTENDILYNIRQKGIDMKIGVNIASLTLKRFVNQIVLISGDADFVPAAKLARREGIDFILDPMWNPIDDTLFEHIDGLHSTCPRPKLKINARV